MTRYLLLIGVFCAALWPLACSDGKDWDEEIILQLFKPKGVDVGQVLVRATQNGASGQQQLQDIFADCKSNRVRVIPRMVSGSYPDVTVTVTASKGNLQPVSRTLQVPVPNPVALVLGTSKELEPDGPCTPQPQLPDGGVADSGSAEAGRTEAGGPSDGPLVTLPTGQACVEDERCKGGVCLKEMQNMGVPITFKGGYCSRDCSTQPCPQEEYCASSTDGNGQVLGKYCLKRCKNNIECRVSQDYICTTAGVCMPE
jgi:hypothetical protein